MRALLLLGAAQALQINHIFRRPTPFLNEKNTFTEDDGYKLLEGHREKRWTLAWARDLLRPPKPGKLVLVRHGESTWNRNATFTGWTDVDLSERGEREVEHASRLLLVLTQRDFPKFKLRRWRPDADERAHAPRECTETVSRRRPCHTGGGHLRGRLLHVSAKTRDPELLDPAQGPGRRL